MTQTNARLRPGASAPSFSALTLSGATVHVPDRARVVHLQFRRFAGCPICNLHLRQVARRHEEIVAAGIHEVALFHSSVESMRPFQGDLPFDVIADPERRIYDQYAVSASLRSILDPRAWGGFVRGTFARHPSSSMRGEGGHTGLPADFLIGRDGRVLAVKYGTHADDQWSVDELLATAQTNLSPAC